MEKAAIFFVVVSLVAVCLQVESVTDRQRSRVISAGCRGLARYNVTFEGLWSRDLFPKQYPLFRPHAQWTKVIGRTHNGRYNIFEEGKLATEALKQFTELGRTTLFEQDDSQGINGVFDTFSLPALNKEGVGTTSGRIIVSARHPMVSLVARVVPSPDWFVGVNSLTLCQNKEWTATHSVELQPYDAGTDMGFTFTAPNWEESPHKPIVQITSQKPSHPANSFYYPDLPQLPPLARLHFTKVGTYGVKEILAQDVIIEEEVMDEDSGDADDVATSAPTPVTEYVPRSRASYRGHSAGSSSGGSRRWWHKRQEENKKKNADIQDCEMGEWSEWGPCSKTCGFGKRMRTRQIIQRPSPGGAPCPPRFEDELCGSMRTCGWKYFSKFDRSTMRRGS